MEIDIPGAYTVHKAPLKRMIIEISYSSDYFANNWAISLTGMFLSVAVARVVNLEEDCLLNVFYGTFPKSRERHTFAFFESPEF